MCCSQVMALLLAMVSKSSFTWLIWVAFALQDTFSVVESQYVVRLGDGIWLRRGAFPRA